MSIPTVCALLGGGGARNHLPESKEGHFHVCADGH